MEQAFLPAIDSVLAKGQSAPDFWDIGAPCSPRTSKKIQRACEPFLAPRALLDVLERFNGAFKSPEGKFAIDGPDLVMARRKADRLLSSQEILFSLEALREECLFDETEPFPWLPCAIAQGFGLLCARADDPLAPVFLAEGDDPARWPLVCPSLEALFLDWALSDGVFSKLARD